MNVEDMFCSFELDEIPRLRGLQELLFSDSRVPSDFDPSVLPLTEKRHVRGRMKLDQIPNLRRTIKEEEEEAIVKAKTEERHAPGLRYVVHGTVIKRLDWKERIKSLTDAVSKAFKGESKLTGDFIYYPGSYREWHTNIFNIPGWRMYLVDVAQDGRSGFRFLLRGEKRVVDVLDRRGRANFFHIDPKRPLLHCVHSDTLRFSKGFIIPSNWRELLF